MSERREGGTITKFFDDRGYGFIHPDSGGKDVFVHVTALRSAGIDSLSTGDRVSFILQVGDRGRELATELLLLESTS